MRLSTAHDISVLLIEDELDIAEMYRLRLISDGYSVLVANTGEEGIRLAGEALPDFIYLDLGLPGPDGFQVLDHLLASPKTQNTPMVIVTTFSDPAMRSRALRFGAVEFLDKADTTPAQLSFTVKRTTSVAA